ncbi:MAG: type II secretion system protein GspD [Kiritimatiellia bacterium]
MKIFSIATAMLLAIITLSACPSWAQTEPQETPAAEASAELDEALLDEILQDAGPAPEGELMTEEDMAELLEETPAEAEAAVQPEETPAEAAAPAEAEASVEEVAPAEMEASIEEVVPAETEAVAEDTAVPAEGEVQPADAAPAVEEASAEAAAEGLGTEEVDIEAELIELGLDDTLTGEVGTGEEAKDLITISLDDVPVQDVVRMFARISGANIVAGTNLVGNVTVNLQDVEWQPALRVILDSVGLTMVEKSPGIFSILSRGDLASEPVITETIFLNYTTVSNIIPVISTMLSSSNASVSGFSAANAVIIQETVERMAPIKETIRRIDQPRSQVFIEAKFVELNDEAIKDIGINWQVLEGYKAGVSGLGWNYQEDREKIDRRSDWLLETDRRVQSDSLQQTYDMYGIPTAIGGPYSSGGFVGDALNDVAAESVETSGRATRDDILRGRTIDQQMEDTFNETITDVRTAIFSADEFALTLSALKQNDGVSLVSNPKILVASGETASIHVGVREPNVRAVPQGDSGDRYAYELDETKPFIDIGVKVDVTPVVNTESNISLRIVPELSQSLAPLEFAGGLSFPRIQSRRVVTDFSLESGRTVAIGGLIQNGEQESVKKVPLLGDIPLIGKYLFRHTHTEELQDEVIIFVTVSMAKTDEMREESGIPVEGRLIHKHMIMKRNALREF